MKAWCASGEADPWLVKLTPGWCRYGLEKSVVLPDHQRVLVLKLCEVTGFLMKFLYFIFIFTKHVI